MTTERKPMKDVVFNDGTRMTDAEYIAARGFGDTLTDYIPTRDDLLSLADALVTDVLADEFYLDLCWGRSHWERSLYTRSRLSRLVEFLPELGIEVREKLRLGREENRAKLANIDAEPNHAEEKNQNTA
jgi:hypothetical protein